MTSLKVLMTAAVVYGQYVTPSNYVEKFFILHLTGIAETLPILPLNG